MMILTGGSLFFPTMIVPLPRPIFGLGRDRAAKPAKLKLLFIW